MGKLMRMVKEFRNLKDEKGAGTILAVLVISAIFASAFIIMQSYIQSRISMKQRTRQAIRGIEVGEELVKLAVSAYSTANNLAYNYFDTCFLAGLCTANINSGCNAEPNGWTRLGIGASGLPGCWPPAAAAAAALTTFCDPTGAANLVGARLTGTTNAGPIGCFPNRPGNDRCVTDPRGGTFPEVCLTDNGTVEEMNRPFGEAMMAHWNSFVDRAVVAILDAGEANPFASRAMAAVVSSEIAPDYSATVAVQMNIQTIDCSGAIGSRPFQCESCPQTRTATGTVGGGNEQCVQFSFGPNSIFNQTIKLVPNIRVPVFADTVTASPPNLPVCAGGAVPPACQFRFSGTEWCDYYANNVVFPMMDDGDGTLFAGNNLDLGDGLNPTKQYDCLYIYTPSTNTVRSTQCNNPNVARVGDIVYCRHNRDAL
jgi:hypothetical protein